jgi:sugar (pentulose or hexulose) kinase
VTRGWLGIDAGTQSVKAVVVDEDGHELASAGAPVPSLSGRGHRQDPQAWLHAARDAVATVVRKDPVGHVAGISVTATSGTVCLADAHSRPLGTASMYDDVAASADGERVRAVGADLWQRLGYAMSDTWALPRLLGLLRDAPPGATVAHQADVLTSWLVGARVPADWSHALKSGYDVRARAWPLDVLDELGISAERLPEVVPPGTVVGTVGPAAAHELGLPAGVPVVAGMTDGCCSQIAGGALGVGTWTSTVGTTLVLKGTCESPLTDREAGLYSHAAPFQGLWLAGGASGCGAGLVSKLLPGADLEALSGSLPGPQSVRPVFPLVGSRERFPFVTEDTSAFVVGRDGDARPFGEAGAWDGTPAELLAGILVGIATMERLALEVVGADPAAPLTAMGAASGNAWFGRVRATLHDRPLRVPAVQGAGTGAALIALAATTGGVATLPEVASRATRDSTVFGPDPRFAGVADVADRLVEVFRERGWWPVAAPTGGSA